MNNYEYGIHEKGIVSSYNCKANPWKEIGKLCSFYSDVYMTLSDLKIKHPMQSKGKQPRKVWVKKNFISLKHGQ